GLTQVTQIKLSLFSRQRQRTRVSDWLLRFLFIYSLPRHAALPLSVTRCGFLEYISGLLNSRCSASQVLLALTQTATNW
ncbi:unnamed protein product, partial [Hymenolepis diminuta]